MFEQLGESRSPHQLVAGFRLSGPLCVDTLQRSLNTLVGRHEALRTRFEVRNGFPRQVVAAMASPFALSQHDLAAQGSRARAVERLLVLRAIDAPFDLSGGPLSRALLIRRSESEHVLLINQHHIVSDGWSMAVLLRDLSAIYNAGGSESASGLVPMTGRYVAYAAAQQASMYTPAQDEALRHWDQLLQGAPSLVQLPTDRPRPQIQSYRCATVPVEIGEILAKQLRQLAGAQGVSVFTVLAASWAILLRRLTGQKDMVIGTPAANRVGAEQRSLVGLFAAPLPLRFRLDDEQPVEALLKETYRQMFASLARQHVPFKRLVEQLKPPRSPSHAPIIQVAVNLNEVPKEGTLRLAGIEAAPLDLPRTRSPYDLTLSLTYDGQTFRGRIEYAKDLFDEETPLRYRDHLLAALASIADAPGGAIGDVEILTPGQRRQILGFSRGPDRVAVGPATMHGVFEEFARLQPMKCAVEFEGTRLSYAELNSKANQLARELVAAGAKPDERIAICVNRSPLMVIAVLAVLKSGAAYVPLDPTYPRDRLLHMLEDIDSLAVLAERQTRSSLPSTRARVIELDSGELHERLERQPPANLDRHDILATTPAYVIYTSGSTGKPKGAANHHAGLRNIVGAQREIYGLDASARILQFASFSFDVCLFETMMALCHGGTLCLARKSDLLPVDPLVRTVRDLRITLVTLPPSVLSHLSVGCFPSAVVVNVTGENFPPVLAKAWAARHRVFNAYGPTETSIWASSYEMGCGEISTSVPIGRPLPNEQLYVLDGRHQLCPVGVAGELYVGGTPVGLGYFRKKELTDDRFIPDPIAGAGRIYRTGDIARWLPDGELQFIGRSDTQIKLRGYRIELGEVEAILGGIDGVREAVVLLEDGGEQAAASHLCAYVVATDDGRSPTEEYLRGQLRKFLPDFMVPARFTIVPRLPLTPNGKVDKKALAALRPPAAHAPVVSEDACSEAEVFVLGLFRELLQQDAIGRNADFFAYGGHSLLAVRLVSRIRQARETDIPIREVFANPTVHAFAKVLEKYQDTACTSNIALLRAGRTGDAVFFVHSGEGEVGYVHRLLPFLSSELSVYAISASGLLQGEVILDSIEAMAAAYVAAVLSVAPQGPYRLVGWSAGGTIAYEMARKLLAGGFGSAWVCLLDSHRDYSSVSTPERGATTSTVLSAWVRSANSEGMGASTAAAIDDMSLDDAVRHLHGQGVLPRDIDAATILRWWTVRTSIFSALRAYRAAPGDCNVLLLAAQEDDGADLETEWRTILGDRLQSLRVEGNHHSMVAASNAAGVATAVARWLLEVELGKDALGSP